MKSEIEQLREQYKQVSNWNIDLQNQRSEQDFRIKNLLDQNSKLVNENAEMHKELQRSKFSIKYEINSDYLYSENASLKKDIYELTRHVSFLTSQVRDTRRQCIMPMKWHRLAAAPKDKAILIFGTGKPDACCRNSREGDYFVVGRWRSSTLQWVTDKLEYIIETPTHWAELPEPPK